MNATLMIIPIVSNMGKCNRYVVPSARYGKFSCLCLYLIYANKSVWTKNFLFVTHGGYDYYRRGCRFDVNYFRSLVILD